MSKLNLGARVRGLRRGEGLSQARLASELGISASYLNMIEHDRRPVSAAVLIKLAQRFRLDLSNLATDNSDQVGKELMEALSDPLFEGLDITNQEVMDVVRAAPDLSQAFLRLYQSQCEAGESLKALSEHVNGHSDLSGLDSSRLPSELVTDFIQTKLNHFPELEAAAEALWSEARLRQDGLQQSLVQRLSEAHGIRVRTLRHGEDPGVLRRFDAASKELSLSHLLAPRSRNFHLAQQVGLLEHGALLDTLLAGSGLSGQAELRLGRVTLASYFAGAVLMPYGPFHEMAERVRYDVELLGHHFRTSFEQVCHRLTTLRRPGAEGVPFHLMRVDLAGNISKRFSASGIQLARFSGACPRWNVCSAFLTPGVIRVQLSVMPEGDVYFCFARTLSKSMGGFHNHPTVQSIGLGCAMEHAHRLVYSDGFDLGLGKKARGDQGDVGRHPGAVEIGVTCRLCPRLDCEQRAFPSLRSSLKIDEAVRGISFYAPVDGK